MRKVVTIGVVLALVGLAVPAAQAHVACQSSGSHHVRAICQVKHPKKLWVQVSGDKGLHVHGYWSTGCIKNGDGDSGGMDKFRGVVPLKIPLVIGMSDPTFCMTTGDARGKGDLSVQVIVKR